MDNRGNMRLERVKKQGDGREGQMRSVSPSGGAKLAAEQTDSCAGVLPCRVTVICSVGCGLNAPFLSTFGAKW